MMSAWTLAADPLPEDQPIRVPPERPPHVGGLFQDSQVLAGVGRP